MLMDDADVATWQNEGLPADRMSTENAAILLSCERWPLMVDPQLQGIKWIKNKYGEDLQVTQIGQNQKQIFERLWSWALLLRSAQSRCGKKSQLA